MRRRRVTYRPSKAQGAFSVVVGIFFVLIGLFVVIPGGFGIFGILWTLMALGITVMSGYQVFGKGYTGPEITIEEGEEPPRRGASPSPAPQTHDHIPSTSLDVKGRLEQLRSLKEAGLMDNAEYEQRKQKLFKGQ